MLTINQQLADAEGKITELQISLANAWDNPDERRNLADQLKATRCRVTELYNLLAA